MTDPRSLAAANATWLTDSRVYNLIWLGRWLERAEGISRAVNSAARMAARSGSTASGGGSAGIEYGAEPGLDPGSYPGGGAGDLAEALIPLANTLGIEVGDRSGLAADILLTHSSTSALHCLSSARLNATQVAPVELIRAIGEAILNLENMAPESLQSAEQVVQVTDEVADSIAGIYEAIEERWFGRESLTEEEVFHRFVQQ